MTKYGGIWIDATVLLSGKLPNYIERTSFFLSRRKKVILQRQVKVGLLNQIKTIVYYWLQNNCIMNI